MMTNASMSVFNKINSNDKKIIFKKHLIKNVFWDDTKIANLELGLNNDDKVSVYIPKNKNDISNYVTPKKYNGNGWTLHEGDYIVRGNVEKEQIESIKELSEHDVFKITSVDDKDFGSPNMQHFAVKGK